MCGIPMPPPIVADAVKGKKLTFDQAVAHVGGADNLISDHGHFLINTHAKQYLWKYPNKLTHCTACGTAVEGFYGRHGQRYACPSCGANCEFRYEAKGHKHLTDQFYLYEWRRSVLDPETVVLTGALVYRNSSHPRPHEAKLEIDPSSLYVFRPGKAATVYKRRWHWGRHGMESQWDAIGSVHPEHTGWNMKPLDIVIDHMQFQNAIQNTRIGRLFLLLREETGEWRDLELSAIANCARRPWLEYVYKSGQRYLAGQLMRLDTVGRDICPGQRAKSPRELLGLTEGQWYEVRRDGICLTVETLKTLRAMMELDIGPVKVADAMKLARTTEPAWYIRRYMLTGVDNGATICGRLARLPGRQRRKILRHILADIRHAGDWRDYYGQLARLNQIPTEGDAFTEADMTLLLPRDMAAMHQRMTDRENAIEREKRLKKLAVQQEILAKRLREKLRKTYTFRAAGLILRPYESAAEVVDEGAALHICIGGYAERYVNGDTVICCLRQANEPDEPWRAVEFSATTGARVQDRGMYNDGRGGIPPGVRKQLRLFWAAWDRAHKKGGKSA